MKNLILVFLASSVLMTQTALPQSPQQSNDQMKRNDSSARKMPTSVIRKASGRISDDGSTFVTDEDNRILTVSNPAALKGYEGLQVTVKAQINTAKNVIHILSVKKPTGAYVQTR